MKILAIRGQNLASLQRAFDIDLTGGVLAGAGLFAITGPVGAGKSTLLDALCLPLFDRTPRLSGRGGAPIGDDSQAVGDWLRGNDPRSLLRRDAVEGHAEVDFVGRDGRRYRARWSVRRARRRADGRLLEQELSLFDLERRQYVAKGRRSEVLAAVELRLGLDFQQFCRSVLLAQGDFAAFLRASAEERARLLENLTGADVYRRLSKAAHEGRKQREQTLATLQALANAHVLLDDVARAALVTRAAVLSGECDTCQLGIDIARSYVNWYETAAAHREHESRATVDLQAAQAALAAATERRLRHGRWTRALPLVPRLELVLERQRELAAAIARREEATRSEAAAVAAAAVATGAVSEALAAFWPGRDADAVPPIVQSWDRWQLPLQQWLQATRTMRELSAQADGLAAAVAAASARARAAATRAGALDGAARAAAEALAAATRAAAVREFATLPQQRQQLTSLRARVSREAKALQDLRAAEATRAAAVAEVQARVQERDRIAEQFPGDVAAMQAAQQALLAAREQHERARVHAGLVPFRAHLVDGEPCPLCGSAAHPSPIDGESAELPRLAGLLAGAEQQFDRARQVVAQSELQRANVERALAVAGTAATAAAAAVATARTTWREVAAHGPGEIADLQRLVDASLLELAAREADFERGSAAADTARQALDRALLAEGEQREAARVAAAAAGEATRVAAAAEQELAAALLEHQRLAAATRELAALLMPAFAGCPWQAQLAAAPVRGLSSLSAIVVAVQRRDEQTAAVHTRAAAVQSAVDVVTRLQGEVAASSAALQAASAAAGVSAVDVREAAAVEAGWLQDEARALADIELAVERLRAVLQTCTELRRRHEARDRPTIEAADAAAAYDDACAARKRVDEELGAVRVDLGTDDLMRRQRDEHAPMIAAVTRELETWRALDDLIGSSTGGSFVVFAQGLTLELLLAEANRRLAELAKRYRLQKNSSGEMDFVVVDLDLGASRRSLQSLSGGETFLVSLALALALATLAAPRSRVETLFLDEGFGTLDAQHLEAALAALDTLQATGCQVGVISHVDGIAERIGAVVEVRPEGGGQSRVMLRAR